MLGSICIIEFTNTKQIASIRKFKNNDQKRNRKKKTVSGSRRMRKRQNFVYDFNLLKNTTGYDKLQYSTTFTEFLPCISWSTFRTKIHAYVLVPKSFIKFMFSKVYRVTRNGFYAGPYTSMWAPVVARQISKRYSSSCHVFISM
jgi:hypothetical protein